MLWFLWINSGAQHTPSGSYWVRQKKDGNKANLGVNSSRPSRRWRSDKTNSGSDFETKERANGAITENASSSSLLEKSKQYSKKDPFIVIFIIDYILNIQLNTE